jgi:uncharacterized protein (TIGR04141 family)
MRKQSNKLSVYLIKDEYTKPEEIIKKADELKSEDVLLDNQRIGTLFFGESHLTEPSWIKKFFGDSFDNTFQSDDGKDLKKLFTASSKAVLLVDLDIDDTTKTFALVFGYGRYLLNHGTYEERFGLRTTLNVIDPNKLRKIDRKSMTSAPKDTTEQLSRAGVAADFAIDIEQDLILAITGNTAIDTFGSTVSGKDSLSVSVGVNLSNINEFLEECYRNYSSEEYKKNFAWIDQISEVRNPMLIESLNGQLAQRLKDENLDNLWMAVPEIVDWHNLEGFSYNGKKEDLRDDIDIHGFLDNLNDKQKQNIDLALLKRKHIKGFDSASDQEIYDWQAFNCLYCELEDSDSNKTYLLSNGKWYEIETNFVKQVNDDFKSVIAASTLPEYNHQNEKDYNEKIPGEDENYCCMDCKIISHGGGRSKIEFCDLMGKDKKLVHVKHYGGSSVLSHLFSQGVVSGELFLSDKEFREKVLGLLPDSHKIFDADTMPKASEYEVVFAVISKSKKDLNLPFFSKVSLRNAKRRLKTFGYNNVSLVKIPHQGSA